MRLEQNLYAYATSNPTNKTDPTGLFSDLFGTGKCCRGLFVSFAADPVARLHEIIAEVRPIGGGAEALFRSFEDCELLNKWGDIAGKTNGERLEWLLRVTGDWLGTHVRINWGDDRGFSTAFQDGVFYHSKWGAGDSYQSNQAGHFLTAVGLAYPQLDLIKLQIIIGHEKLGDNEWGLLGWPMQFMAIDPSDYLAWRRAREYDEAGDPDKRDAALWPILDFEDVSVGDVDEDRVGNSLQDLRLSLKGTLFAKWVRQHGSSSPVDAGDWLRHNLGSGAQ